MPVALPEAGAPVDSEAIRYVFKASVAGGETECELRPGTLFFRKGGRAVEVPYGDIRQVRLAFRPTTIQSYRFIAEIWPAAGGKLTLCSVSARSIMEQQRLDAPYNAFVAELHRRLIAAGAATRFRTGSPVILYWLGVAAIAALCIAAMVLMYRTLPAASWTNAALFLGMLALFLWQMGAFLYRNQPGTYAPDRPPRRILPG